MILLGKIDGGPTTIRGRHGVMLLIRGKAVGMKLGKGGQNLNGNIWFVRGSAS
jgi:hypothetical protein